MKVPVQIIKRDRTLDRSYLVILELGIIASLGIMLLLFRMDFNVEKATETIVVAQQEEVFVEEIVQTKQVATPPPPPRPPVPVEVPNDEVIEDEIINLDAELDLDAPLDLPPPPRPIEQVEEEEEIFIVVEQPPSIVGGIAAIQRSIVYPEIALKAGIEGRVVVQIVIDKDGQVKDPVIIRGIGGGCDEEAIRAIRQAKFSPGMQRGRPVSVRYTLPITFKINNS